MSFLIHHLIDATAQHCPERGAMYFLDQHLTYGELMAKTNRLAHALIEQGVQRRDRIGIYMDKCLNIPVAMYGIMKAGAVYVPLDPSAPPERIAEVIRDCGIRHLVTATAKLRPLQALAQIEAPLDCLIGLNEETDLPFRCMSWDGVNTLSGESGPRVTIIENDLAYIIYTSGSTGKPKGIMHTHHSGLSFARWAANEYGLRPDERLSNHAPLHFDLSIFDFFAGAVAGASTVIIPEEYTKLPASYSQLIANQRISVLFTVPFALIQLLLRGLLHERDFSALRWIIFGGEPFPIVHLRKLMTMLPHVHFDNMYGPAEINGCTHYTLTELPETDTAIPIGPIAASAEGLIVDDNDVPVQSGTTGELLVRTPTMMRGYWGRDDLNERAFYRREIIDGLEEVFYRTGDLVEEQADGVLRFLGRKDRQVKVRGYRIELDEIETALTAHEAVEEAAVFSIPDREGSQQINALVTLKDSTALSIANLLKHLKARLSWYSIPASLEITEQFPRTSTGKIDRKELQARTLSMGNLQS